MRISDNMRYGLLQANISKVAQQLDSIQTQIATQKSVNSPSDDPIKFTTYIQYQTELDNAEQYNNNLQRLSTLVGMYGTSFDSISSQLTNVFQAANSYATMSDELRDAAVEQIKSTIEQFVTIGNTKLGSTYIFGGMQADTAPFRLNNDYSVTYNVSQLAEDATNIYVDAGQKGQYGISGREAFYGTSKIAFGSVTNTYTGDLYSNTASFAYVIDSSNNSISVNGTPIAQPLDSGVYTGAGLAKEIQEKLGPQYSVAFDSATRKFQITNNTGADVTLSWSDKMKDLLGFNGTSALAKSGQLLESDFDSGRQSFLIKIISGGSATGDLASRAQYSYSIDGGDTYRPAGAVSTGGADGIGDITITQDVNDTFYVNGTKVTIPAGAAGTVYTGSDLAAAIQTQLNTTPPLGTNHVVAYDALTRKFTITNNTGTSETYNWSDSSSNAAGVLGFDAKDSVVSSGSKETGDYDAGMFIDGTGVVNNTNHGMKFAFSLGTDVLSTTDTFQVKDLSVFELLKNLKDAFETGNATWVSKNAQYIQKARDLTTKNNAVISFQGTAASTLIDNNKTKTNKFAALQSDLVKADTASLATQFNVLLTTYQALLSTLSKMQSISILDYLK